MSFLLISYCLILAETVHYWRGTTKLVHYVKEYWLFDPKGEWIPEQLQGYRLRGETYEKITDSRSEPLQLRLAIEGILIGFYREDTGEKLLTPDKLAEALAQKIEELKQEIEARQQAEKRAEKLAAKLRELNVDPDSL